MSRTSSGDWSETHPYLKPFFYTIHMWSLDPKYTDKARDEFRRRELAEVKRIEKLNKVDSINWAVK